MKTIFPIALLLFSACGSSSPETKFLGLWEYQSGTREGVSCFKHIPESTTLVGTQVVIEPNETGYPKGASSFVANMTVCREEVWLVADTTATLIPRMCSFGGGQGLPGSEGHTYTGSLLLQKESIAIGLTDRIDWNDGTKIIESCTYTIKGATLSYIGPFIR